VSLELEEGTEHSDAASSHTGERHHRALSARHDARRTQRRRAAGGLLAAGACYLVLGVVLWWHVWTSHPTSTLTCGCGDPALFLWFFEWPAYAITHGHNPFFSTALFHPGGINLLAQTSVTALAIPLAPVTWLFGPVASLNVASTLVPALSALSAFWALRHWVRWQPAAFCGGLLYGFSPFVLGNLEFAHLMAATLVIPPLLLVALDDLLLRQRHRPTLVGGACALLLAVEFFLSTELVVIFLLCTAIGTVLLVLYQGVLDRTVLAQKARHALPGVVCLAVGLVVLLAYPTWFALDGPAHLSGQIWPNIPQIGGYTWQSFVDPSFGVSPSLFLDIGGYLGPVLPSSSYFGAGLLLVVGVGTLVWRSDRRLWFFGLLAVITASLSLGERKGEWQPWRIFSHFPILDNVIEQRIVTVTFLALAVMLAIVMDRARDLPALSASAHRAASAWARHLVPPSLAVSLALLSLVPIVWVFAPKLPFTTRPVGVPAWFAKEGHHQPPHSVLLVYPAPFSGIQSAMAWQAVDEMDWAQAGGGGPQGTVERAGPELPGFKVLTDLGFGFGGQPEGTRAQIEAVRAALRGWEVTTVVIPDQRHLAPILRGNDPVYAAAFMTAAIGRLPKVEDGAWVWTGVRRLDARYAVPVGTLSNCTDYAETRHLGLISAPFCVELVAKVDTPG
jgi:hypothetical protein